MNMGLAMGGPCAAASRHVHLATPNLNALSLLVNNGVTLQVDLQTSLAEGRWPTEATTTAILTAEELNIMLDLPPHVFWGPLRRLFAARVGRGWIPSIGQQHTHENVSVHAGRV